jgi:nucleotide-binding universal stress UspA family protein
MSEIKSILLHLDASSAWGCRVRIAARIARLHDAEVTALYAVAPAHARFPLDDASPDAARALEDVEYRRLDTARKTFAAAAQTEASRLHWACVRGNAEREFGRQTRFADLVILGQREPGKDDQTSLSADFVENTLIACGRPTLVVPYVDVPSFDARVVVVAWKNTRESARALAASLPFLSRCRQIHVVEWDDDSASSGQGPLDVESYLRLHGLGAACIAGRRPLPMSATRCSR